MVLRLFLAGGFLRFAIGVDDLGEGMTGGVFRNPEEASRARANRSQNVVQAPEC